VNKLSISISTYFNPFRMNLRERKPVSFTIEIVNREEETKLLSMEITLSEHLSFERNGFKTMIKKQLDLFQPNEKKRFFFDIYSKAMTKEREQPIRVKVLEHYNDYRYVVKETKLDLGLKVE
jgi:hypothetical protein